MNRSIKSLLPHPILLPSTRLFAGATVSSKREHESHCLNGQDGPKRTHSGVQTYSTQNMLATKGTIDVHGQALLDRSMHYCGSQALKSHFEQHMRRLCSFTLGNEAEEIRRRVHAHISSEQLSHTGLSLVRSNQVSRTNVVQRCGPVRCWRALYAPGLALADVNRNAEEMRRKEQMSCRPMR